MDTRCSARPSPFVESPFHDRPAPGAVPLGAGFLPPPERGFAQGEPAPLFDRRPNRERLSWEQLTRLYDTFVIPRAGLGLSNDEIMDDLVRFCREWQPDLVLCGCKDGLPGKRHDENTHLGLRRLGVNKRH